MGKIKIILAVVVVYFIYKGFTAMKDFNLAVTEKVQKIEEIADIEKESTVIGLMMYIGDPLELKEHLMMSSKSKCLENKEIAESSSSAYYECAEVNAVVKGGKIINVIEEIKIFE
tara:strand:- start:81 stop:425 length:345 start_codon:yes stop_codon:yes gene_type:complete